MTGRRDFLKLFGIGAVVAPVVGGALELGSQARIIEVPRVEPIETPKIEIAQSLHIGEYDATIYLRHKDTGDVTRWDTHVSATDLWHGLDVHQATLAFKRWNEEHRPQLLDFRFDGGFPNEPRRR